MEGANLPSMRTDEGKVSQILRNFISNAIKFTPQGEIKISAELRGSGSVLFEVTDTGIGIPEEHLETVFQEFSQIENPLQERYRGTGLGLPLCRKMALLLGGKVWVKSEIGRGSSFFVELPIVYKGEADVAGSREEMPAPEFSRPTVLLIAPDAQVFSLIDPVFKTSEFQLIHVESLDRAETWLQRHQPRAVVLDISDLENPGWDFLRFFPKQEDAARRGPSHCGDGAERWDASPGFRRGAGHEQATGRSKPVAGCPSRYPAGKAEKTVASRRQ